MSAGTDDEEGNREGKTHLLVIRLKPLKTLKVRLSIPPDGEPFLKGASRSSGQSFVEGEEDFETGEL